MLHLLCGAPGSGKTTALLSRAADLLAADPQHPMLFLVPEQEAVSAESRIFSVLPPSAPLCVEVDNFSRLTDSVLRRTGGVCRTHIGRNVKRLCMYRALGELGYERGADAVADRLSAVNELTNSGATPEKLAAAADRLAEHPRLSAMLREYANISAFYGGFLSELGADANRDGELLCAALVKNPVFRGADVYIDGFTSFTGIEYEIIGHLLDMAAEVTVTLAGDPDGDELWLAEIRECAAHLRMLCEKRGIAVEKEVLSGTHRAAKGIIERLSSDLWRPRASETKGRDAAVRLVSCATPMEEAEFVAADVARAVRSGMRYGDIAVVCRSADAWRGILDTVLREHGIPTFVADGFRLDDAPAVRFLCRVCAAAVDFDRTDVAALLKTDCVGLSADDCDRYIRYAQVWRIGRRDYAADRDFDMNPEGFRQPHNEAARAEAADILAAVNRVRAKLYSLLAPLSAALANTPTVRDAAAALYTVLVNAGLREKLMHDADAALASGDSRTAADNAAVWNAILAGLDALVFACGDDALAPDDLPQLLKMLFADTEISSIPTSADAVTFGAADMLRMGAKKRVYLIGLSEGEFPAAVKGGREFFSRSEAALLRREGIALEKDTAVLAAKELFLVRRAISYAAESLVLSYHRKTLDGSESGAGSAVSALYRLYPDYKDNAEIFDPCDLAATVWDRRGAALAACRGTTDEASRLALADAAILAQKYPAVRPWLSPAMTERLLHDRALNLTPSRLETYGACRFRYFCQYLLDLHPDAEARFDSANAGTYLHAMLERLVPRLKTEGLTGDALREAIRVESDAVFDSICPPRAAEDARLGAQIERLRDAVLPIAEELARELSGGSFEPVAEELKVGGAPDAPRPYELPLDGGRTLRLSGTVDRADALRFDGGAYLRVIDYKTYKNAFRLAHVDEGSHLQLLVYLLTLCRPQSPQFLRRIGCPPDGELRPAGMLYCVTGAPEDKRFAPPSAEDYAKLLQSAATLNGVLSSDPQVLAGMCADHTGGFKKVENGKDSNNMLLDAEQFSDLAARTDRKLTEMANRLLSGDVSVGSEAGDPQDCDFCPYGAVCRKKKVKEETDDAE